MAIGSTQLKSQVVADVAMLLSSITTVERADEILRRALRVAGLTNVSSLTEADVGSLLQAIAAEGGAIQMLAQQIATHGLDVREFDPNAA